uniref:Uncharacterized protein n=1 Tax=Branchiostoma floridae TaxID=7739 RepID=C3Y6I9_BRAFL|eukprot:XP_002607939.1 hypothetical protein BRAFLDRAFT_74888 [Branchiostoma floridae]
MVVTFSVLRLLKMREDQQEANDQKPEKDDDSSHEYEDLDNNHQNGVQRNVIDRNNGRDDVSIHEYEDIDNNQRNDDTVSETEVTFYAAAAEAITYESADPDVKKTDSVYNKDQLKLM